MTRQFHQELQELKLKVQRMGGLAEDALLKSVAALRDINLKAANDVIVGDAEINRLDVEIERDAMDLLARNSPMAHDLRVLGAVLKMITYLDRIGRYGYDIANAAKALEGREHVRKLVVIPHMAEQVVKMLHESIDAFVKEDAGIARAVIVQDELADALYDQIFRECVTFMVEDPRTITTALQYILVARHLERVGDNACKIAEKTVYMVTGERRLKL